MSDTPETDARTYVPSLGASTVPAEFARQLERERDEAHKIAERAIDDLEWFNETNARTLRNEFEQLKEKTK
jgi:hypothetical protein